MGLLLCQMQPAWAPELREGAPAGRGVQGVVVAPGGWGYPQSSQHNGSLH